MTDLRELHHLVGRVRRRLKTQQALEWGTLALIPAIAGGLAALWLWRMEWIGPRTGLAIVAGLGGAVALAALAGALRGFPTARVAARIDRASHLSDRLGTAVDFSARLADPAGLASVHPDTQALMRSAVADGVRAVARADVVASAPLRPPRDLRAAAVFAAVALAVVALRFGPERRGVTAAGLGIASARGPGDEPVNDAIDADDIEFQKQFVEDMQRMAEQTGDEHLAEFAKQLQELLGQAQKGQISKQDLIVKMEALEKKYMQGSDEDVQAILAELKDQGKELQKNPSTKRLGDALQAGDMEAAQKELERLADKIEKNELSPEDQKQLADALQKAAEKQEAKQQKEDQNAEQQAKKLEDEIRRLKKQVEEQPKNEQAKRTLEKKRNELERLERQRQEKQAERELDRLRKNLKLAAENLKLANQNVKLDELKKVYEKQDQQAKKDLDARKEEVARLLKKVQEQPNDQEAKRTLERKQRELEKLSREQKEREDEHQRQLDVLSRDQKQGPEDLKQRSRKSSSQQMRQAQQSARRLHDQMRRTGNQKRVQSQLSDLKEAIRRAKPRKGQGSGQGQGQQRLARIKEWERRAGGGQGNPQTWRQGQGQPGSGQSGQDHNGGQLGGKEWGDEHDENLMGDPTQLASKKKEEDLTGIQGPGASRRETILTSAKKGFATTSYKKVYADYKKIVEEVMNQEKVPAGYKYYVKRYFERIKPHDLD
jgi:hypothetical protein